MAITLFSLTHLADQDLPVETRRLADAERRATAQLIAALMELDARKLYLGEGCSSLFVYCTRVLRLSESAAYARIEAARTSRRFPIILELLVDASITLTTVVLLAPVLDAENHVAVLATARHKSKREVQEIVARLRPAPAVCSSVRKLPGPPQPATAVLPTVDAAGGERGPSRRASPGDASAGAVRPAIVAPVAPDRYKIQFTINAATHARLRRVQDIMRHSIPNGDPAIIFDRALNVLLRDLERKKVAAVERPRSGRPARDRSRHIPAAIRRRGLGSR